MGDRLRIAVGFMGNAASVSLFAAPILTFTTVVKKKCTQDFSCIPYIVSLLNCLLYTWYGTPIVSNGWENIPVITTNGVGVLLESSFILIYLWFASPREKVKVAAITVPVVALFCTTALISAYVFPHHERKIFVGSVALVASIVMYGSPLVAVKQVIATKSVKFMPFYLSLFSFLASSLWMTYGLLSHDLFLMSPNLIGCPLGILQLVLYCVYRKKEKKEISNRRDLEKNDEELKEEQQDTDSHIESREEQQDTDSHMESREEQLNTDGHIESREDQLDNDCHIESREEQLGTDGHIV